MNIVITGSTRGIGFAAARKLLHDGHAVTLCSEDESDVIQALAALEQDGLTARGASSPVPFANAYGPSKTWIRSFSRAIARELQGTKIATATFQPGLVHTKLTLEVTVVKGHEHRTKLLPATQRYLANSPDFAGDCMARTITGPMRNGKAYRVPFVRRSLRRLIAPPPRIEVATHMLDPETDTR